MGKAIESALGQTYKNVEVIVIDDGSTDASLEIIKSFGDRIRWETGPNRGACAARNRGLELARGTFIQFLDADDLLKPQKLAHQVPVARAHEDEIVYCDRENHFIEDPGRRWTDKVSSGPDPVVFALTRVIQTAAPIYLRDILLRAGGYREGLQCAQERDLHLRLALAGWRFRRLPEVLVTVRRHAQSISSDSLKVLRQRLELHREVRAQLNRSGTMTDERRAALAVSFASVARVHVRAGLLQSAERLFDEAREIHPDGLDLAYSPPARMIRRLVGAVWTERLVGVKRRILNPSFRPR